VKRYRFRLEAVLRVRRVEADRAAAQLAVANRAVHEAEAEVDRRLVHYQAIAAAAGPVATEAFVAERSRRELAAKAVVAAGAALAAAQADADASRALWSAAAMRVRALERLDERRQAEHDVDVRRDEVVTLDEAFAARLVGGRA
jgi:flagellar export protein FliJ